MAARPDSAKATVATSPYAISVESPEDEKETETKHRLASNGRYVLMSKSVIRSERGGEIPDEDEVPARSVLKMLEKQPESIIFTRTLFDYPKIPSPPRNEVYRRATPEEVSKPTEFIAYMRDAKPVPKGYKKTRFSLPEQQPLETLHAVNPAMESKVVQPPPTQTKNCALSDEDIPRLRQQWYEEFKDILQGTPEELPPLREVNHEINLIDPDKK